MADGNTTKPRQARKAPTTPDPIEIAMEAEAGDGRGDSPAQRLLVDQGRLVRWQIASERAGFALKVLTGLAGLAAAGVLGWMAWSASQDRSVVIDPLRTPADLAQQGADGTTLANALQDRLATLVASTYTALAAETQQGSRPTEVRVQIPATGVSVADLDQALRVWLGRRTHVTGELRRISSGPQAGALAINVRVGATPGARFVQPDGDVDALLAQAAEHVYAHVEPLRYANWLAQTGHSEAEVIAQFRRVLASPGPAQMRAVAANILGGGGGGRRAPEESRRLLREAIRLSGGRVGTNNLGALENRLGRTEVALGLWRNQLRQNDDAAYTDEGRTVNRLLTQSSVAGVSGDFQAAFVLSCHLWAVEPCARDALIRQVLAAPERLAPNPADRQSGQRNTRLATADRYVALAHEPGLARRLADLGVVSLPPAASPRLLWGEARIEGARMLEDWPVLLTDLQARRAIPGGDPPALLYEAYGVLAYAKLGDGAAARAAEASLPADCYRCQYVLAMAHEALGDRAGADRRFAEAIRQGPSLAWAETEWARVLLARGDTKAAIVQAKLGRKKAPAWADPLEIWGEALLAKGDAAGAVGKFRTAAEITPRWGRLHLKWGEALAKQGKVDEARAKWGAAASMDLTPTERAELARVSRSGVS